MATLQLNFGTLADGFDFNSSLQVGDTIYYASPTTSGGFSVEDDDDQITLLGVITNINPATSTTIANLICDINNNIPPPPNNSYILFSKDRSVNVSNIKGYYSEVKFNNDSKNKAELFATSCEINETSK
jgi:hypothetical protein|tara:strand:+ start:209 stop:595 length:387 start_codon:yes stop_codon:yes gene_type:complete